MGLIESLARLWVANVVFSFSLFPPDIWVCYHHHVPSPHGSGCSDPPHSSHFFFFLVFSVNPAMLNPSHFSVLSTSHHRCRPLPRFPSNLSFSMVFHYYVMPLDMTEIFDYALYYISSQLCLTCYFFVLHKFSVHEIAHILLYAHILRTSFSLLCLCMHE